MLTLAQILVAAIAGTAFGFAQSFAAGMIARSWDGGTGLVWGLVVAVPAGVSAIWIGWYAIIVGLMLAIVVFSLTWFSIMRDRRQKHAL